MLRFADDINDTHDSELNIVRNINIVYKENVSQERGPLKKAEKAIHGFKRHMLNNKFNNMTEIKSRCRRTNAEQDKNEIDTVYTGEGRQ
jgi:hypothetical protein